MERHINTECSVMTGKPAKKATPTCARTKCGKVLFSPILCNVSNIVQAVYFLGPDTTALVVQAAILPVASLPERPRLRWTVSALVQARPLRERMGIERLEPD